MTTYSKTLVGTGAALIALVSLILPLSAVHAADWGGDTSWGYDTFVPDVVSGGGDTTWGYDTFVPDTSGQSTWGYDTFVPDSSYASNYGYSGYGSTGSSFGSSMPSFGSGSTGYNYPSFANAQARSYIAPSLPSYAQPQVSNACTAVNSCNVDNHVVDNSVYSAPTTVTVTTDSHNQQIAYPQPTYQTPVIYTAPVTYAQPVYNPPMPQPCYNNYANNYNTTYNNCNPQPVVYNKTPYVTLSQVPYTGLDLGPMGEVLYWAFLVLWCLGAAYLIVVKRVQNKLVSYLNGFLFGSASTKAAHTTYAPRAKTVYAAPAPAAMEDSIDPFIASQIKRA